MPYFPTRGVQWVQQEVLKVFHQIPSVVAGYAPVGLVLVVTATLTADLGKHVGGEPGTVAVAL